MSRSAALAAGPVPEALCSNPAPRRLSPMAACRRLQRRASDLPPPAATVPASVGSIPKFLASLFVSFVMAKIDQTQNDSDSIEERQCIDSDL